MNAGAPWPLLTVLLVLGVGVPAAGSERAATLPGVLGAGARWWQDRKSRRRAEAVAEARAAAELSASERVADKEIARLDQRYTALAEDCAEDARRAAAANMALTERVDRLEQRLTASEQRLTESEQRFYVLLGHHRRTVDSHLQHAPGVEPPEPPPELRQYLG